MGRVKTKGKAAFNTILRIWFCFPNCDFINRGGTLNTQQVTTSFEGLLYSRFCLFPFGAENNIEFLPMNATAPLWFLTSLFMGFCTYYLLFGRAEQKTTYDYVCAVGCVVMTIILSKLPILLPWSIDMAFLVALFIWLGKKARRTEKLSNISLTAIGFACLLLYVILVYKNGSVNLSVRIFGNLGWKSVGICTIVGATYFLLISVILRFSPQLVQRPLAFIGNHALRLMCVHMPVFFFVDTLLPSNEMDLPYIILSKFATAVCVSWMLGFMIARSGNTTIKRYL